MDSGVKFDWDDANTAHAARHGVSRAEAEQVMLNGPIEVDYQNINGEERYDDGLDGTLRHGSYRHGV